MKATDTMPIKTATAQTANAQTANEVVEVVATTTHRYIEELGIWVNHELSTYDKKMITRARNKKLKAQDTATAQTATAQTANEATTNKAFGIAWGADGQVLTYDETKEAIANRQGWFDRQGRWVNYARMMQEARLILTTN